MSWFVSWLVTQKPVTHLYQDICPQASKWILLFIKHHKLYWSSRFCCSLAIKTSKETLDNLSLPISSSHWLCNHEYHPILCLSPLVDATAKTPGFLKFSAQTFHDDSFPTNNERCWQHRAKTEHTCRRVTPFILNSTFLQGYVMSVALQSTPYTNVCLQSSEHERLFLNLAFHIRRLKLELNLICWRTQILGITARRKRNVSHFNYPLALFSPLPSHNSANKDAIG